MKAELSNRSLVCPRCGQEYHGQPALSRNDNQTLLCPDCGICQALESIGVEEKEQKAILATIHRYSRQP